MEKREINGITHRRCNDCGEWTPFIRARARCDKCHKVWNAIQNKRSRERRKAAGWKNYHFVGDYMEPDVIKRQLKGDPIPDLFANCTKRQIEAMKTCNVNMLLQEDKT